MKCIITIEDTSENTAKIDLEFEPPIEDGVDHTTASYLAVKLIEHASVLSPSSQGEAV